MISVQYYECYCTLLRGPLFSGHSVYIVRNKKCEIFRKSKAGGGHGASGPMVNTLVFCCCMLISCQFGQGCYNDNVRFINNCRPWLTYYIRRSRNCQVRQHHGRHETGSARDLEWWVSKLVRTRIVLCSLLVSPWVQWSSGGVSDS